MNCKEKKELDDGNCGVVRLRGKEAYVKDRSLRTETGSKADCAGKLAQHSDAHSSVQEVKQEVVCRNNVLFPGKASFVCGKGSNCIASEVWSDMTPSFPIWCHVDSLMRLSLNNYCFFNSTSVDAQFQNTLI